MTPDPLPSAPGYELLDLIARSAAGVRVYRTRDLNHGREVAVKLLPRFEPSDPSHGFLAWARAFSGLYHPGIPTVYHIGEFPDGQLFVAMKFVRGLTLADLLRERPDPSSDLPRFVRVFRQVCDAVGFAHSQGVIRQHLMPGSVVVCESDDVQLLGWSNAFVSRELTQEVLARHPNWADVGMGMVAFMPPEQVRGEPADERSDVFGLGGILCHILTGAPPYLGENLADMCRAAAAGALSNAFARLDACRADPRLVALCKRCLAPNRADRPANGTAVAELLQQFAS